MTHGVAQAVQELRCKDYTGNVIWLHSGVVMKLQARSRSCTATTVKRQWEYSNHGVYAAILCHPGFQKIRVWNVIHKHESDGRLQRRCLYGEN